MVVFGDSLSDSGNNAAAGALSILGRSLPATATFPANLRAWCLQQRTVWASDAASPLGVPLAALAGGRHQLRVWRRDHRTPGPGPGGFPFSLLVQASQYLGSTETWPRPMRSMSSRAAATTREPRLPQPGDPAAACCRNSRGNRRFVRCQRPHDCRRTQIAGAQHIVVWDTPDLGIAPAVRRRGVGFRDVPRGRV